MHTLHSGTKANAFLTTQIVVLVCVADSQIDIPTALLAAHICEHCMHTGISARTCGTTVLTVNVPVGASAGFIAAIEAARDTARCQISTSILDEQLSGQAACLDITITLLFKQLCNATNRFCSRDAMEAARDTARCGQPVPIKPNYHHLVCVGKQLAVTPPPSTCHKQNLYD